MVPFAHELKQKRAEIGLRIEGMRKEIAALEQQQSAFDIVIRTYEPEYTPATEPGVVRRRRQRDPKRDNDVSDLFRDFDRRGFVLRTLREAGHPISTAECAMVFARAIGLEADDIRLGKIGNRLSQTLDQLARANRVRRAGKADGHRYLWEVAI
jgi:hypothetical protein